jgi:hypothetical protein
MRFFLIIRCQIRSLYILTSSVNRRREDGDGSRNQQWLAGEPAGPAAGGAAAHRAVSGSARPSGRDVRGVFRSGLCLPDVADRCSGAGDRLAASAGIYGTAETALVQKIYAVGQPAGR